MIAALAFTLAAAATSGRAGGPNSPCRPETKAFAQAARAVDALDRLIEGLADTDDARPASQSLRDLLRSRCWALSPEHPRSLDADSALALKAFWRAGGADWVRSYLRLDSRLGKTEIVIPPDVASTLSLETPRGGAPAQILCSLADGPCRAWTRDFLHRTETTFAAYREDEQVLPPHPALDDLDAAARTCLTQASAHPARSERYLVWRGCLEDVRPRAPAMPLGAYRPPSSGFWVLHGLRGDSLRRLTIADLGNGALYSALQRAGSAAPRLVVGQAPVERLREAALVTMLAPQAQMIQPAAVRVLLPAPLVPGGDGPFGVTTHFHHGAPDLWMAWFWAVDPPAAAPLPLYQAPRDMADYALRLLDGVEADTTAGCPSTDLPLDVLGKVPDIGRVQDLLDALKRASAPCRADDVAIPASASPSPRGSPSD